MSEIHQICPVCAACNTKQKDGYYMCCACRHKWRNVESASVFDHITQSVEALANELVYWEQNPPNSGWTSSLIRRGGYKIYRTKSEAIAATVAKLKKEWMG